MMSDLCMVIWHKGTKKTQKNTKGAWKNNSIWIASLFQVETFHTELALTYLEKLSSQDTNFLEPFRNHLLHSDQIQFKYLLSKVEASPASNNLLHEKAILYGKVSNFCLYYHLGYFSSSRPKFMCQQPFLNLVCWV